MSTLIRPRSRTIPVRREGDGTLGGFHVEHWDGRVDATVLVRPAHCRLALHVDLSLRDRALARVLAGRGFGDARKLRRAVMRADDTGAVTVSGLFVASFLDVFDATQAAYAFLADTCKGALFTNTITPNFSTDTAYGVAPYNANEITGTGYTAGGVTLAGKTVTESPAGTLMVDCNDPSWAGATFSLARALLVWDDTMTAPADMAIVLVDFDADYGVTSGTFAVQLAATGLYTIDLTP